MNTNKEGCHNDVSNLLFVNDRYLLCQLNLTFRRIILLLSFSNLSLHSINIHLFQRHVAEVLPSLMLCAST